MTRIEKLQSVLPENADAALIVSEENRFYFTGFAASDGFLAVTRNNAIFITDSRYTEAAEKAIKDIPVILQTNIGSQLTEFFAAGGAVKIAVEADRLTLKNLSDFEKNTEGLVFVTDDSLMNAVNGLRTVKDRAEIECIKTAQTVAEIGFDHILGFIKPGLTEKQVQLELDYYMLSHGAEALSFQTIAVSGANSSLPHGVPSDKKIENGDFLTLDFGAVFKGYHSDMTRTVAVGSASDEMKKVYGTVLEAQEAGLAVLRGGISGKDADKAARDVIAQAGYGEFFGHGTGHGVGIEIHENPSSSPRSSFTLVPGDVVTVEPGIYLPGKFGVRIEDMALITENGFENLTKSPKHLIIL